MPGGAAPRSAGSGTTLSEIADGVYRISTPVPPNPALPATEGDILSTSEGMRGAMDYASHGADTATLLAKLAATAPLTLACMHGASWRGDGAALLGQLSRRLTALA